MHCKFIFYLTWFCIGLCLPFEAVATFGYIESTGHNIGDDIQSIAAKQFLPKDAIAIERDYIHQFHSDDIVHTIINGWFMHTKKAWWPYPDFIPPEKSWPPSASIDPLLISIHFTGDVFPEVFSDEGIAYLKKHGPVGARDEATLKALMDRKIPSYFSGCLTLTLENNGNERDNVIYAVDLDPECINFIKSKADCQVVSLSHNIDNQLRLNEALRGKFAECLLEKYRRAKCVITSRLHAALPCLAFETPVLLINTAPDQERFAGLKQLLYNCSKLEFLSGAFQYNFNRPPQNSKEYLPIRKDLIKRVTEWVEKIESTCETTSRTQTNGTIMSHR